MRSFIYLILLLLSNCALTNDSDSIRKNLIYENKDQKKISDIQKNMPYTINMSFNEFKIYIDDFTKKSKYPDINQ